MRLLEMHPGIATLDCEFCQKYMVDETTGIPEMGRGGRPELRILNLGPEFLSPCRDFRLDSKGRRIRSCPKGSPENPKTLSAENEICFEHYQECRAVGRFPDDAVVRRNAAIIRDAMDFAERSREIEFQHSLFQMRRVS